MKDAVSDLNRRIGERIRDLRAASAISLEALAAKCGVSRSMISLIERAETSPTAVVLEKLAAGLNVSLASLFETSAAEPAFNPVALREDQPTWRDPASGYLRRVVSPPGVPQPIQLVEIEFPAGQRVPFESGRREARIHQQIWVLEGKMEITVGTTRHRLDEGDCLAMQVDGPILFHNPTRKATRYAVVTVTEPVPRKR